ncbi:PREDICTED: cingulin-like protein 1 [Dipodomys ordii]|uniref:Cingulin-like protein 1 n=1 Tax=Dipodomys ordii TaxID=10020 RepID=A0A1S3EM13_DIPOR|nr:PREDICTED: cingulin-like protein 1 [Dipodomys ordii]
MELYFGEYQHVQQEYGVHLRLASDEAKSLRNSQPSKTGSYGVSIRVQGIDGHPYIVLNNTERCLARPSFPDNGPSFPSPTIHTMPLHASNGSVLKESGSELQIPENPYAQPSPARHLKPSSLHEGKNGILERKGGPARPSHLLNCQRHPELLQPYDPQKSQHPPDSPWLTKVTTEGTPTKTSWTCFPPCPSPPGEDLDKTGVTAIRLCSSVVIEDPQKQTSVCVNVQSCSKDGVREASPRHGSTSASHSPQGHPEAKKARPDVLPFRRQDSAGPVLDGGRSRRSSSASTTPTSANSLYRFLLDDQDAIHADHVNRHENRRYIPFLPGTGRDIDTGSMPCVDELIEKFDGKSGLLPRRGRSGKRGRINPEDRKRSRSVDSAFPFGLQGNAEYLSEFTRNLGKSSEHLLRPSQLCPQRPLAPEQRGQHSAIRAGAKPPADPQPAQGAHPGPPQQPPDRKVPENKESQESVVVTRASSSLPVPSKKEEIKTATATLMLQSRATTTLPDPVTKKISVKSFPSSTDAQATPDLLKGQQELTRQTNEETAKQILYNYLKEGSTDNEDATKRKVNLVFEKIQTLKSRAAGSTQGNNQASSSELKDLLEQKNKLALELAELEKQLQQEVKNQQNIKEERDRMRASLEELRGRHESKLEEIARLQKRLEESEGELQKHLEELFQVKMEREQHQTEIRDLQDQLSEMHDELDSAKRSEDREKGALIEELLQAKQDLQDLLIAKEELEDLLRKRERELTALKGALKEEVSSHDQEMEKLKEQYDAELQALRESVEEATKNVEVLAGRSSAEQRPAGAGLQEKELAEENTRLRLQIAELQRRATELQEQLEARGGQEMEAKDALLKCKGEMQQLAEALESARKEEEASTEARRALESELEKAQRALSRTTQEHRQLCEKLQDEPEQKEQLRKLRSEMESERWCLDKTIEKLQKEMADIVEASRTSTLELQSHLDEYKEKTRRELTDMQRQLKEKTLEAEKARLAASNMREEMRLLEEELRDHQRSQEEELMRRRLLEQTLKELEYELEAKSHVKDERSRLVKQMEVWGGPLGAWACSFSSEEALGFSFWFRQPEVAQVKAEEPGPLPAARYRASSPGSAQSLAGSTGSEGLCLGRTASICITISAIPEKPRTSQKQILPKRRHQRPGTLGQPPSGRMEVAGIQDLQGIKSPDSPNLWLFALLLQMEQMRSELLQERAVKQDLECDKISLERQNKDLKSRIIHLEGSYRSSKEGLVAQMEARITELEDRLESEERDRASLQLSNRRLERKVKELVMQVDDEHLSLTDQKDQLSLRLKAMKRQVEEAEEEIDRLESSKKKLQRELEEQLDVNEHLQGQLNSMKKDLRLKKLPSKVLDDMDDDNDDDLSTDGGSLYEAPLSYAFPRDSASVSQI